MTRHYAFEAADGHVAFIEKLADDAILADVVRKFSEASFLPVKVTEIDKAIVPPWTEDARRYRNAWRLKDGALTHDMDKARDIHRVHIRQMRQPELVKIDVEVRKAAGDTAKLSALEAQAQKLRDLPADPKIDAAKSVDDLRATWPAELAQPVIIAKARA